MIEYRTWEKVIARALDYTLAGRMMMNLKFQFLQCVKQELVYT